MQLLTDERKAAWSFSAVAVLFFSVCAIIAVPCMDDFSIWGRRETYGVFGSLNHTYMHWSGRWAATLLATLASWCIEWQVFLPLYFLLTFGMPALAFCRLLGLVNIYPAWPHGLLLLSSVFWLTTDPGQSWLWMAGSSSHLWGWTSGLWGIYFVLKNKHTLIVKIASFLCFMAAGGFSENAAVIWPAVLAAILLLMIFTREKPGWTGSKQKIIIALIGAYLSILVLTAAPGNAERLTYFDGPGNDIFLLGKKAIYWSLTYLYTHFLSHLPYVIIFALPWALTGRNIQWATCRSVLFCWAAWPFFLALYFLPQIYATNHVLPERGWGGLAFYEAGLAMVTGLFAGKKLGSSAVNWWGATVLILIVSAVSLVPSFPYSLAFQRQFGALKQAVKSPPAEAVYYVKPLPPSGILPYHEWGAEGDSSKLWINKAVENTMHLPFAVRKKE